MKTTQSQRDELRKLEQAATGAPWEFYYNSPASGQSRACVSIPWNGPHFWRKPDGSIEWHDCPRMIAWQSKTYEYGCCTNPDCEGCGECESIQPPELGPILDKEAANLRLLSAARNSLADLLDDVEELRRLLRRASGVLHVVGSYRDNAETAGLYITAKAQYDLAVEIDAALAEPGGQR